VFETQQTRRAGSISLDLEPLDAELAARADLPNRDLQAG
jgi:hypothetical protein